MPLALEGFYFYGRAANSKIKKSMNRLKIPLAILSLAATHLASASAVVVGMNMQRYLDHQHQEMAQHAAPPASPDQSFGTAGDPAKATRNVEIDMLDSMRFFPSNIQVKQGETVRFVVSNKGKVLHEIVLGTKQSLAEHGQHMKEHPNMAHQGAYMANVAPGKSTDVVWKFTKTGTVYFGCLVPGHYEAGMTGTITVSAN